MAIINLSPETAKVKRRAIPMTARFMHRMEQDEAVLLERDVTRRLESIEKILAADLVTNEQRKAELKKELAVYGRISAKLEAYLYGAQPHGLDGIECPFTPNEEAVA